MSAKIARQENLSYRIYLEECGESSNSLALISWICFRRKNFEHFSFNGGNSPLTAFSFSLNGETRVIKCENFIQASYYSEATNMAQF